MLISFLIFYTIKLLTNNKKSYIIVNVIYAPVAQLDRVLGYEPIGREFESLRVHHKKTLIKLISVFFN